MSLPLNPRFRFDTFVVGAANRLAATAARAVSESPGVVYNPLFIYGGPGLGKTHLLMAVAQAAKAISPSLAVAYQTLDDFVEAFHAAISEGQGDAYRRRFADLDLLLLDDVQFLSRRREMQSELLRLVNTMQTAGKQIVLTSDRPPAGIESLDERLVGRFGGGLVIDVSAPDYETRMAILRRQAEAREIVFAPGVLEVAASVDVANIRELLGAFNRLIAWQAAHDEPLSAETARGLLHTPSSPPAPTLSSGDDDAGPVLGTPPEGDEFGMFLTEITTTVSRQLEQWRTRVSEAILRWQGEGYRVTRLQDLFEDPGARDVEAELVLYATDVARLRELEREAAEWDPAVTADPVFHDPDRLAEAEAAVEKAREGGGPLPGPSPHWRMEDFEEVGDNRVATRAAAAVIADPGRQYNSLVLAGPGGTGKTHLLHAIGNELARRKDSVVACLSAREFVDGLIDAIDRDRIAWWRSRYRRVTDFLLDDIHLLEGTDRTQEELFWLFNALHEDGRQMVFTVRGGLDGLTPRLASRLAGGLVAELPPPGREVREAVAARLLSANGGVVDSELPVYLAARADDGIRALHEAINQVRAASTERSTEITTALAREILEGNPSLLPVRRRGARTSGVVGRGGILSREKTIWEWPDAGDRILEGIR